VPSVERRELGLAEAFANRYDRRVDDALPEIFVPLHQLDNPRPVRRLNRFHQELAPGYRPSELELIVNPAFSQ